MQLGSRDVSAVLPNCRRLRYASLSGEAPTINLCKLDMFAAKRNRPPYTQTVFVDGRLGRPTGDGEGAPTEAGVSRRCNRIRQQRHVASGVDRFSVSIVSSRGGATGEVESDPTIGGGSRRGFRHLLGACLCQQCYRTAGDTATVVLSLFTVTINNEQGCTQAPTTGATEQQGALNRGFQQQQGQQQRW